MPKRSKRTIVGKQDQIEMDDLPQEIEMPGEQAGGSQQIIEPQVGRSQEQAEIPQQTDELSQEGSSHAQREVSQRIVARGRRGRNLFQFMRSTIGRLSSKVSELERRLNEGKENQEQEEMPRNIVEPVIVYQASEAKLERPKYPGKIDMHPVTFIEDLFAYLNRISRKDQVIEEIIACLEGEVRKWARIYKDRWITEEDFKKDFLESFWSETEQNQLRRSIVCGTWNEKREPSMMRYFISLASQAKMLARAIPEDQLVADLMNHFPIEIQYVWRQRKSGRIIQAAEFLRELDDVGRQCKSHVEVSINPQGGFKRIAGTTQDKTQPGGKRTKLSNHIVIQDEDEQEMESGLKNTDLN
ncbi:hypothetical protein O0L34_g2382 [Tuta absoluta]|nr:hypothetical protein O0L34_g2382 [Tuta absoluta]